MRRAMNFGAGPATLPLPALERARDELLDFAGSGASVMELSHRVALYGNVHEEAVRLVRELGALPPSHEVVFLTGGASAQFANVPLNFLGRGKTGAYVVTGTWGQKALEEAVRTVEFSGGEVETLADTGHDDTWTDIPDSLPPRPGAAYVHVTTNETVHGVQFHAPFPDFGAPVVADMSSDFFSRPTDFTRFDFAYAGAQKNIGPSGLVVGIVRKSFLDEARADLPKILRLATHVKEDSLYNTPPTFSIYLVRNVLAWMKEQGGLEEMARRNAEKGAVVYGAIDGAKDFYTCPVAPRARSLMNVVFRLPTPELEERFLAEAKGHAMMGLKGHRSVGGIRASLYNAVPVAWAKVLADFMGDFARRNG